MKNTKLVVFICVVVLGQMYADADMPVVEDHDKKSFSNKVQEQQHPLLMVPKLHDDIVQAHALVESLVKPSKVDHVPLWNDSDTDLDFLDPSQDKIVYKNLERLPEKNRPADIAEAMSMAKAGEKVFNLLAQGRFYDAIAENIKTFGVQRPDQIHAQQVFEEALNMNDIDFWNLIKNDQDMAKSITNHGVPFTFASLQSAEFNMFFRNVYIRVKVKNQALFVRYQRAYQRSIVQLQWHLFSQAIVQDRAFTSGMITFHDPQLHVFRFLDGYAEFMSPKYKFHDGIGIHSIWADQAYTRESSHWTGQKAFDGKNFGIDIKGTDGKPMSILPGNKSHLLFGMRTNGMTFVKWEEYGTTFNVKTGDYSVLHHTLRYLEKKNLEDDPRLERREKIPTPVHDQFKKLYSKPLTPQEKALIETNGISGMLSILKLYAPTKVASFKQYLVSSLGYQASTLPDRKGSEVILTLPTVQPNPKTVQYDEINEDDL